MNSITEFFASLPQWPIEQMTGYKPQTTFWQDFSIADVFVINSVESDAVRDTHNRSWPQMKEKTLGIEGLTEYIMVLNWKIHEHYDDKRPGHRELAEPLQSALARDRRLGHGES